jgi:hypothetical protein
MGRDKWPVSGFQGWPVLWDFLCKEMLRSRPGPLNSADIQGEPVFWGPSFEKFHCIHLIFWMYNSTILQDMTLPAEWLIFYYGVHGGLSSSHWGHRSGFLRSARPASAELPAENSFLLLSFQQFQSSVIKKYCFKSHTQKSVPYH